MMIGTVPLLVAGQHLAGVGKSPYLDYAKLRPLPQRISYDNNGSALNISKSEQWTLRVTPQAKSDAEIFVAEAHRLEAIPCGVKIVSDPALETHAPFAMIFTRSPSWNGPDDWPVIPKQSQGYAMRVETAGIVTLAADSDGMFYGLQTILQGFLSARDSGKSLMPSADITDWPAIKNRSVLLHVRSLHSGSDMEFVKQILSALANLKCNSVFFQFEYALPGKKYPSFPYMTGRNKKPISDEQACSLCDYARTMHMDVNLSFQLGGHCTWILYEPAYKDCGETLPEGLGWLNTNWSPANPKLWKLVEDIVSHQIEVCRPKIIHIAHDEMAYGEFNTSESSKAAGLSDEELVALGINKLRDIIPEEVEMMAWCDMFLPKNLRNGPNRQFTDPDRMMELTPKDMLMNLWYYKGEKEHVPAVKYLREHNRRYWLASNKTPHIPRVCQYAESLNADGILCTVWYEAGLAWDNPKDISSQTYEALVTYGAYAWNPGTPERTPLKRDGVSLFKLLLDGAKTVSSNFASVDITPAKNFPSAEFKGTFPALQRLLGLFEASGGVQDSLVPFDIDGKTILLAGDKSDGADLPTMLTIPVGKKIKAINFLHGCGKPSASAGLSSWNKCFAHPQVGEYRLIFEDPSDNVTIPLKYRWNIQDWNHPYGSLESVIAWSASFPDGVRAQLQHFRWSVPDGKERMLKSIIVKSNAESGMNPMLLAVTAELNDSEFESETTKETESVWKDSFDYVDETAMRTRWSGEHFNVPYRYPHLTRDGFSGSGMLLKLSPASKRIRDNFGMRTETFNLSKANILSFRIRMLKSSRDAASFTVCLYLGKHRKNGDYWYTFAFPLPSSGGWEKVEFPLSAANIEGNVPEEGGMGDLDTLMLSIWHKNDTPVEIAIDDIEFTRDEFNTKIFNSAR